MFDRAQFELNMNKGLSYEELLAKQEVKPSEVEDRAKALLKKDFPITALVKKYATDLGQQGDDSAECKLMVRYITRECIEMGVPWRIFVDGAFKPQKNSFKISYHSHYSAQLYRHYANQLGLPLQSSWRIKYKVVSAHYPDMQSVYSEIAMYQNKISDEDDLSPEAKKIYAKFKIKEPPIKIITIPKKSVVGFEASDSGLCFALSGCYDIIGAAGYMYFENETKKEKFYFESNLDIEKTNLYNKDRLNVKKPTPYGLYPDRIITTKWCSKCLEAYYRPKMVGLDIELGDDDQDAIHERAKGTRAQELENKLNEKRKLEGGSDDDVPI